MTVRHDDGTWPLAGWRIWHAPQAILRRQGYAYENSLRGLGRAAHTGRQRGWKNPGIDNDIQCSAPCAHRQDCPAGLRGTRDPWSATPGCQGHAVLCHWRFIGQHDHAVWLRGPRAGQPVRRPVDRLTLTELRNVQLRGGYRIIPVTRAMRIARRLGLTPGYEVKGRIPRQEFQRLHALAEHLGLRYGYMALPENLHHIRQAQRGPAFGMALTRRTLRQAEADDLDGAKIGRSAWVRRLEVQGKRVLGRGRRWGQSN